MGAVSSMDQNPMNIGMSANPTYMSAYNREDSQSMLEREKQQEARRQSYSTEQPVGGINSSSRPSTGTASTITDPFIVDPFIKGQGGVSHLPDDLDMSDTSTGSDSSGKDKRKLSIPSETPTSQTTHSPSKEQDRENSVKRDSIGSTDDFPAGSCRPSRPTESDTHKSLFPMSSSQPSDYADRALLTPMASPPGPYSTPTERSSVSPSSADASGFGDMNGNESWGAGGSAGLAPIFSGQSSAYATPGLSTIPESQAVLETPPPSAPPPAPPPLPSDYLVRRQWSLVHKESKDLIQTSAILSSKLDENWEKVKHGFTKIIHLIDKTRKESSFRKLCDDLDDKLNNPYFRYSHKDERKRMGNYLATETEFASVVCRFYFDLMKAKNYENYVRNSLESSTDMMLQIIRNFMWNFTDMSTKLARKFADQGIIASLLSDVKIMTEEVLDMDAKGKKADNHPIYSAFGVLHNCAKAPNVKIIYSESNGMDIIFPYIKCKNEAIKAMAVMILSYIIDEEKNDLLLADNEVFDFTIFTLKRALNSADKRADGFSCLELTEALTGMAKNDKNKILIVKRGGLKPLTRLLESGDEDEQAAAAEAIWTLAFKEKNKEKIKDDTNIVQLLQNLTKSRNRHLRKRCEGALWEIQGKGATKFAGHGLFSDDSKSDEFQPHIMLSYNWEHQELVKKIASALQSNGYKTWIDVEQMEGSTLQAMAEAVEKAVVVLLCMSEKYKDSPNCRSEAEYAYRMNKEIIPLMVQPKYRPNGWLGLILGTKVYYDFSGRYPFDMKLAELMRVLGQHGKSVAHPSAPVVEKVTAEEAQPVMSPPAPTQDPEDISKWQTWDVREWLKRNDIPVLPKLSSMEGKHVAFLKKLSIQAPEFFYNYLERNLGLTDLDSLMKFSDAVEALP